MCMGIEIYKEKMMKKVPKRVAEIKVTYQPKIKKEERYIVTSSQDAYLVFVQQIIDYETIDYTEVFWILLLNRANEVIGYKEVSKGGISGTVVDARVIFGVAVKCNACSLILCHNHPSGNKQPSQTDIDLTKKLVEGGKQLDIIVLDHLIVTREGYFSMADEGHI